MKGNLPLVLCCFTAGILSCRATEPALEARQELASEESVAPSGGSSRTQPAAAENSRGTARVTVAAAKEAPAIRSSQTRSSGTLERTTISEISHDTAHVGVQMDQGPARYRYTKSTIFVDESGSALSPAEVQVGAVAT